MESILERAEGQFRLSSLPRGPARAAGPRVPVCREPCAAVRCEAPCRVFCRRAPCGALELRVEAPYRVERE